ncbi:hypothetical protein Ahy_A05g023163 isoform D [Arachis hypogaea]|uniref:Uncharacterized protein n=1 Tax=Arachis hypogaea TaxID=3818 RepID=A0A445D2J0_ARAHY|nr:hypothetical protein Ahy_A05g023163 isoform D [Arachis hypogaea]
MEFQRVVGNKFINKQPLGPAWNSRSPCPLPAFSCFTATSLPLGRIPLCTYPNPPDPRRLASEKPSVARASSSYKCFDIIYTEEDDIYQAWRFRAIKHLRGMLHAIRKKGVRPYWIPPEVLGELMRRWDTDAYRQLQARNTAARKSTRGTSLHTAGGTTFLEARLRLLAKIRFGKGNDLGSKDEI